MNEEEYIEIFKDVLLDFGSIENISCYINKPDTIEYHKPSEFKDGKFKGVKYHILISCDYIILKRSIKIVIGINQDFRTSLFDFYICNYSDDFSIPFIPHVSENGKLCLCDIDNVLIDSGSASELFRECVNRSMSILINGFRKTNCLDLINEFDSYWAQQKSPIFARFNAEPERETSLIKYIILNRENNSKLCHIRIHGNGEI